MIGAGGTLIKTVRLGGQVTCYYVTNGAFESAGRTKTENAARRRAEAQTICGYTGWDIVFGSNMDGSTMFAAASLEHFSAVVAQVRPTHLLVPWMLDAHNDHRTTNQLVAASLRKCMIDVEVWSYPIWSDTIPNSAIDITDVLEEKIILAAAYES